MGDGEINEGSVWEASLSAQKHELDNLIVLIDYNKIQSYGYTKDVVDLEPLTQKFASFGFDVSEVNGHDVDELKLKLHNSTKKNKKPKLIICHTIKGKGFKFAENNLAQQEIDMAQQALTAAQEKKKQEDAQRNAVDARANAGIEGTDKEGSSAPTEQPGTVLPATAPPPISKTWFTDNFGMTGRELSEIS